MRFTLDRNETKQVTLKQRGDDVFINVNGMTVAYFDSEDNTLSVDYENLKQVGLTLYEI